MKWPAYPEYKASGVEWVAEIPAHWNLRRARFLLTVNKTPTYLRDLGEDDEVSFVPMDAIGTLGGLTLDQNKALSEIGVGYTAFQNGDVIVAKITPCFENGKGAIAEDLTNGVAFGTTELHVLRPQNELCRQFLFYLTISTIYRKAGEGVMYGAGGQQRIAPEFIKDFPTPYPCLSEQWCITEFLDTRTGRIDVLVARKRELIDRIKEKRAALIVRTVTRGLPPDAAAAAGLDPAPPLKPTGVDWIADIPQHWALTRLRRCATIQTGVTLGKEYADDLSESRPYLRVANVQDGYLDLAEIKETVVLSADASRFELRSGDVLMTEGGDFDKLGRGCVWYGQIAGCLHQNHIFAVRPDTRKLVPEYLSLAMTSDVGKHHFTRTAQQSTNLATTNQAKIKDFPFPLPPLPEQRAILDWMAVQETRFRAVEGRMREAIGELEDYRSALITAAVTGKIDVRGWREAGNRADSEAAVMGFATLYPSCSSSSDSTVA